MTGAWNGSMVTLPSAEDRIHGFLAVPDDGDGHPAIVVIQEIWGLTDHIKDIAGRLAKEGHFALAPDLYSREGTPQPPTMEVLRPFAMKIPDSRILGDLQAAVAYLSGLEAVRGRRIGVVGFCNGGTFARLLAAHEPKIAACVDYYGRIHWPELSPAKPKHPVEYLATLTCPYLGLFAGEDPTISAEEVKELKARLAHNKAKEIHVYPGTPHAFFNDTRPSYRQEVAADAWRRTLAFFAKQLASTA